ncbi:MAG: DUF4252 domain-containing protein [Bacteroidales bacterium]
MKKIVIIMALAIMPLALSAQEDAVERVFSKYAGSEGLTSLQISKGMFSMLANMDKGDEEMKKLASSVNSVYILHAPKELVKINGYNFYNEIINDLPVEKYEELMRVNSSDQQVIFLADEYDGIIRELLMIVGGDDDNVLICIKGNMDIKHLSSLSHINAPGMDQFMNLE